MKRAAAALHVFFASSVTDAAGKFLARDEENVLESTAGVCPPDDRKASHGKCDERRDIIVVDIAAALMVLLYITKVKRCCCLWMMFISLSCRASHVTRGCAAFKMNTRRSIFIEGEKENNTSLF
jgi:hypothetical protein